MLAGLESAVSTCNCMTMFEVCVLMATSVITSASTRISSDQYHAWCNIALSRLLAIESYDMLGEWLDDPVEAAAEHEASRSVQAGKKWLVACATQSTAPLDCAKAMLLLDDHIGHHAAMVALSALVAHDLSAIADQPWGELLGRCNFGDLCDA